MTRHTRERLYHMQRRLTALGFSLDESDTLRRIEKTLNTWGVHECNGTIQRDEDTGKCYWYSDQTGDRLGRTSDREAGAIRRLERLLEDHPGIGYQQQGDPRGCCLWIYSKADMGDRDPSCCYTDGIPCCID